MFKFIHAADIHLDSPLLGLERYEGAPAEEIRGATRKALENLVALAIEQSVAFVVIAGDLYDGDWKEFRTGLYFVKQMARLNAAGIPVFVIAGNHDAANKMTRRLPLPANVRVLSDKEPETIRLDPWEVAIHGRSFPRRDVLENLVPSYPKAVPGWFNIGLLHTSATGYEGHDRYAPCTLDEPAAQAIRLLGLGPYPQTRRIVRGSAGDFPRQPAGAAHPRERTQRLHAGHGGRPSPRAGPAAVAGRAALGTVPRKR